MQGFLYSSVAPLCWAYRTYSFVPFTFQYFHAAPPKRTRCCIYRYLFGPGTGMNHEQSSQPNCPRLGKARSKTPVLTSLVTYLRISAGRTAVIKKAAPEFGAASIARSKLYASTSREIPCSILSAPYRYCRKYFHANFGISDEIILAELILFIFSMRCLSRLIHLLSILAERTGETGGINLNIVWRCRGGHCRKRLQHCDTHIVTRAKNTDWIL